MFIEKAMLDSGNPLIFNNEQMSYNQIKVDQEDLFDDSGKSWIGIYVALQKRTDQEIVRTHTITVSSIEDAIPIDEVPTSGNVYTNEAEIKLYTIDKNDRSILSSAKRWDLSVKNDGTYDSDYTPVGNMDLRSYIPTDSYSKVAKAVKNFNGYSDYISNRRENAINYNNLIVDDGQGNYKQVIVKQEEKWIEQSFSWNNSLGVYIKNSAELENGLVEYSANKLRLKVLEQTVSFVDVPQLTSAMTYEIKNSTIFCNDAPYYLLYLENTKTNLNIAMGIISELGANCYDAQILPYAPDIRNRQYYIDDPATDDGWTIHIKMGNTTMATMYSAEHSSFAFQLMPQSRLASKLRLSGDDEPDLSGIEMKVKNETEFIRICSPNGCGEFEMSLAKNGGIRYFNVECSYKPISPYINVSPNFSGIYGKDFKDYRGLIVQGDLSIPIINDSWVSYEQNNKNYLNSFNREVDHIEYNNKYAHTLDIFNAVTGSLTGGLTGATAGGMLAGATGLGIGAVAGTTLSAAGGIADVIINQKLRNEALNWKQDEFEFQLGNIKARPNTLAKTGSIMIDNHYVPYIEFYSATEIEKEALRNKLKYNGMTVGIIGKMEDYLRDDYTYIKGKLIRLENINEDFHLVNTIAEELYKGVYIK